MLHMRNRSSTCAVIEGLHDHVPADMTGGRIKEYLSPKELNSFSKLILLFLPSVMAAVCDHANPLSCTRLSLASSLAEKRCSTILTSFFLSQMDVNIVGRVCCDSVGKLNASSLMLEGSLDLCHGQQVKVDLSNVQQFALFPGQVMYSSLLYFLDR